MSTYRNITINGWNYLTVNIGGKMYLLGKTGRFGDCQDHGRMFCKW